MRIESSNSQFFAFHHFFLYKFHNFYALSMSFLFFLTGYFRIEKKHRIKIIFIHRKSTILIYRTIYSPQEVSPQVRYLKNGYFY